METSDLDPRVEEREEEGRSGGYLYLSLAFFHFACPEFHVCGEGGRYNIRTWAFP